MNTLARPSSGGNAARARTSVRTWSMLRSCVSRRSAADRRRVRRDRARARRRRDAAASLRPVAERRACTRGTSPHASGAPRGAPLAHERLRQPERRALLADAVGPVEEVRVVHAARCDRAPQRVDRRRLRAHGREEARHLRFADSREASRRQGAAPRRGRAVSRPVHEDGHALDAVVGSPARSCQRSSSSSRGRNT